MISYKIISPLNKNRITKQPKGLPTWFESYTKNTSSDNHFPLIEPISLGTNYFDVE